MFPVECLQLRCSRSFLKFNCAAVLVQFGPQYGSIRLLNRILFVSSRVEAFSEFRFVFLQPINSPIIFNSSTNTYPTTIDKEDGK